MLESRALSSLLVKGCVLISDCSVLSFSLLKTLKNGFVSCLGMNDRFLCTSIPYLLFLPKESGLAVVWLR